MIHQSWKTKILLPKFEHLRNTFLRDYNETYETPLWTDDNNLEFMNTLEPEINSFLRDRFKTNPILLVDFCRYLYMHHYGGVYFDLDSKSFKSLDILFNGASVEREKSSLFLARMGSNVDFSDSLPNAFMASRKGHPFWNCLIGEIVENEYYHFYSRFQQVESRTGPRMLKYVVDKYPHFNIHIFNSSIIFPFNWNEKWFIDYNYCNLNSRTFNEEYCDNNFKDTAYSISYWSHTWQGDLSPNLNH
jgi:mannosyltransferase OCH1-like enzyme